MSEIPQTYTEKVAEFAGEIASEAKRAIALSELQAFLEELDTTKMDTDSVNEVTRAVQARMEVAGE